MKDGTSGRLRTVSPVDGRVLVERPRADEREIARRSARRAAQPRWRAAPLAERRAFSRAVDAFVARGPAIARRSRGRWAGRSRTARASCAASRSARAQ